MFLSRRFYIIFLAIIFVVAAGYWWSPLMAIGEIMLIVFVMACLADGVLLWSRRGMRGSRRCATRFSNGDDNRIEIETESSYAFAIHLTVIDEIPAIFQRRDIHFTYRLAAHEAKQISYTLRPTRRGSYQFGHLRVFVASPLGLLMRRFTCGSRKRIKVYPSYLMLRQYELLAASNHLTDMGIKRQRRAGNNTDFELIRDYVAGDDYRTINWKATARRAQFMVNQWQDERSQQIFAIVDTGRVMRQAFNGLSLLDYAINASLVLAYIVMRRDDKAGLITFGDAQPSLLKPSNRPRQMEEILKRLYRQESAFGESDFSELLNTVIHDVQKRSLLVLFTHFDNLSEMNRQLPALRQLARRHTLLVVFFRNSEVEAFAASHPATTEEQRQIDAARHYMQNQRLIASTLIQNGIQVLHTLPSQLSINVINRYLELRR